MKVERDDLEDSISKIKSSGFDYLVKITAVDYVKYVEVIYFFRNLEKNTDQEISAELDPSELWVKSIMGHYKAADWYERELSEMFGIKIKGRKASKLLLEKWDGKEYPLRKSFAWNAEYKK